MSKQMLWPIMLKYVLCNWWKILLFYNKSFLLRYFYKFLSKKMEVMTQKTAKFRQLAEPNLCNSWPNVRPNYFGQKRPNVRPNSSVRSYTKFDQLVLKRWDVVLRRGHLVLREWYWDIFYFSSDCYLNSLTKANMHTYYVHIK